MTDSDPTKDTEPDLQLAPDGAAASADAGADAGADGQWVWQFAAPPPPPSFGARFFSGQANKDHYRFFACAVLVIVGCLLPWGPVGVATVGLDGDGAAAHLVVQSPDVLGVETPAGALSMLIGLWLLYAACHGVYTGHHKILPVFLMIEPAIVTWLRTLDAWGRLAGDDTLQKVQDLFIVAGTGVMLTLIGSTFVAGGFLMLLIKVYAKKDDKGATRRSARGGKDEAPAKGKRGGKDNSAKSAKTDKAAAKLGAGKTSDDVADTQLDAMGGAEADGSGKQVAPTAADLELGELDELTELAEVTPDDVGGETERKAAGDTGGDGGSDAGGSGARRGGSRGRRGRRR